LFVLDWLGGTISKVGKTEKIEPDVSKRKSLNQHRYEDVGLPEHLLPQEVDAMMKAIRKHGGRRVQRDAALVSII
jgi:hypothetical protein